MGREMGGEMLGGGVCTAEHEEAWDHVRLPLEAFAYVGLNAVVADHARPAQVHIQAELGSWHHVAMVYDGARVHFYVDGVAEPHSTDDVGPLLVRNTPVVIGQAGPGKSNEYFEGLIDEVKLYSRALQPMEIRQECGC